MSFSAKALSGYFDKCGISSDIANIVVQLTGDDYLRLQSEARMDGLKSDSKAAAAVKCAELVLMRHGYATFFDENQPSAERHIREITEEIVCSACCIAGVYAYSTGDKDLPNIMDAIKEAMNKLGALQQALSGDRYKESVYNAILFLDRRATGIRYRSAELGARKGIWTRIFG